MKRECDHTHNEICDDCESLGVTLKEIEDHIHSVSFSSDEDRDEALYLCQSAQRSIYSWKCHQLRCVHQDKARLDVLDILDNNTILIISDWAMKFLPQMYRESQTDWFAKRGISWHISVVYRKDHENLQTQAFISIIQSCNQDSSSVIAILQHVIQTLKTEHPEIDKCFLRQDNAGCYHSSSTHKEEKLQLTGWLQPPRAISECTSMKVTT